MTTLASEPAVGSFSRLVNVEKIKSKGLRQTIQANEQERQGLAEQLTINAVDALVFNCVLKSWKSGGIELSGQVTATVKQTCVVTLEVFSTEISQDVKRYFDNGAQTGPETSLVLDYESIRDDLPDPVENGLLDIGEIAVETLSLCLSVYPRKPGAVFADHMESVAGETESENPFDVLQKLKKH